MNSEYNRSGTLWEGMFKSSLINSERYLMTYYRYIEENPIRAGIVQSIEDYRWSSYHYNTLGVADKLIIPHLLCNSLAQVKEARQQAYKQLFEGRLHEKMIELFNDCAEKGDVLSGQSYHSRTERLIGRVTIKGHHGGDRKSERYKDQQLGPSILMFQIF